MIADVSEVNQSQQILDRSESDGMETSEARVDEEHTHDALLKARVTLRGFDPVQLSKDIEGGRHDNRGQCPQDRPSLPWLSGITAAKGIGSTAGSRRSNHSVTSAKAASATSAVCSKKEKLESYYQQSRFPNHLQHH